MGQCSKMIGEIMHIKSLVLIVVSYTSIISFYNNADYKILCLKGAVSGQDQKLKGLYHTAYSTADDYRCYIKFKGQDVKLYNPAVARYDLSIQNKPTMPSYDGKLVYFINNLNEYTPLIDMLKRTGLTLKDLGSPTVKKSWEEIAEEFKVTFE